MRLKSAFWVSAYIRRCGTLGASAVVVRKGEQSAGAIFIKVNRLDGTVALFGPAPAGQESTDGDRLFCACIAAVWSAEPEADAYLARQARFDPDFWLLEVEDRQGRHFLGSSLITL